MVKLLLAKIISKLLSQNVISGNWPWMVALGYKKWSDPSIDFRCGASLITDEWLLTAAHCLIDIGNLQL